MIIAVSSKLNKNNKEHGTIILPTQIIETLNKELTRVVGEEATSDLNYEQGKKIGASLVHGNFKSDAIDIKRYLEKLILIGYYSGVNSKDTIIKSISKDKIIIIGKSKFNPKNEESNTPPMKSFVVGELVGFIEELTKKKWIGRYSKQVKSDNTVEFIIERII